MELCHWEAWSEEWFPESFAPHYSQAHNMGNERIAELDQLNLIKSTIAAYLILLTFILRASHYILLPLVALVGSPCFLVSHIQR